MSSKADPLGDALRQLRTHRRQVAGEVREALAEKRLVSHASAISYQLLFALLPLALAGLALLSVLGLGEIWNDELRGQARDHLSCTAFQLVDGTVQQIMSSKRTLWLTAGAALAIWKLSVAARVTMDALDEMYRIRTKLTFWRRLLRSLALAVAAATALILAAVIVLEGGRSDALPGPLSFFLRWGAATLLMLLAAGLILRYAPAKRQPAGWVTVGSLVVTAMWIGASLLFGVYAAYLARWSSLFGGLTTVIVLMLYLYVSAIVFLLGAQVDMVLRTEAARARG
ncbi:MAG: YihY/virulence factor BrkB family protein [Gaiellaceae bacterium]